MYMFKIFSLTIATLAAASAQEAHSSTCHILDCKVDTNARQCVSRIGRYMEVQWGPVTITDDHLSFVTKTYLKAPMPFDCSLDHGAKLTCTKGRDVPCQPIPVTPVPMSEMMP